MAQEDKIDSVKIYLKEISKIPLLTPKKEVHLFKKIEEGEKELRRLLHRPKTSKLSQKTYYLKRKVRNYKQKIIKANLRLVVSVAKGFSRYCHSCLSFLDLIQEGNLGLKKAVDKFKYKKGFKFSTYAPYWIRKYIWKGIAKVSRPRTWSLDTIVGEDDDEKANLKDIIPDRTIPSPEDALSKFLAQAKIEQVLSAILSEQEKDIIKLRYGFLGKAWTLKEVGQLYSISSTRVSQIEVEAKNKLQEVVSKWQREGKL